MDWNSERLSLIWNVVFVRLFKTKHGLNIHVAKIHGNEVKKIKCEICGKSFLNENDFEVHKEKGNEKVCELKSVVFDERNYNCEVCNFECSEECVFKRHNKVNHDKTTQSTTLYPKKRRKLSGEDQMETSESIETHIVDDDLTIQGEVLWVDA